MPLCNTTVKDKYTAYLIFTSLRLQNYFLFGIYSNTRKSKNKHNPSRNMQKNKFSYLWISLFILIILGSASTTSYFFYKETSNPLSQIVRDQLDALKKGNIARAYYVYTSDNYQDNWTLEKFRKWVSANPVLINSQNFDFYGDSIRNDHATVTGEFTTPDNTEVHIVYRLVNEYGDWKIDNIQILETPQEISQERSQETPDTQQNEIIARIIQEHLLDIKYQNLLKAYNDHLAPEFKKMISYEDYEAIIRENPELTDYDLIQFGNVVNDNGLKRIDITLVSDEESQKIKFWLAKVRGHWMIWAMEVNGPSAQQLYELGNDVAINDQKTMTGDEQKDDIIILIKKQLDIVKDGKLSDAYKNFTAEEFKEATSEEAFKKFVDNYPEFKEFNSIRFGNKTENNGIVLQQVILTTNKGDSEVDYWISKENGDWKIWGIRVDESAYYPPIKEEEKAELVQIIKDQLKALRGGDTSKAYYAFVSQDFENNTSFEDFKSFLEEYPIFTEQDEVTIGNGVEESDLRLVRIALQSEEETAEVDYRLIKQDDDWKIWGIQILTNVQDTPENEEEVNKSITNQINALREGDLSKAYYAFTSKQFQEAASFETYEKYVKRHEELSNNKKVDIEDVSFKPNFAAANVLLTSNNGDSQSYLYRLVYENNKWKILSIKMVREGDEIAEAENALMITKIEVGTQINLNGLVTNPSTTFLPDDMELTVNVHLQNGQPGDLVEAVLEHMKSSSTIPPVTAKLDKAGESVVNYIFSAPTQGWPTGSYKLHITTSTGESEEYDFNVKKDR